MCRVCKKKEETNSFDCHQISLLWKCVSYTAETILSIHIELETKDIIFGVKLGNSDIDYCNSIVINHIILICKWVIWKHRNKTKYENTPSLNYIKLSELVIKECKRNAELLLKSKHRCRMKNTCILLFEKVLNLNFV